MFSPGCHGPLLPFSHDLPLSWCSQLSPRVRNHSLGSSAVPQPSPVPVLASALPQLSSARNNKLTLHRCFSRVFIQWQSEEQNSVQTTPQCHARCCTEPRVESSQLGEEGEAVPSLCHWTEQDEEPVCTHTHEGTPHFVTENLSTGLLDEAGAQQDTGADPPAAGAAPSARSVSNPRLAMAQAPALGLPGGPQNAAPRGSFPALLPGVTAAPGGPSWARSRLGA